EGDEPERAGAQAVHLAAEGGPRRRGGAGRCGAAGDSDGGGARRVTRSALLALGPPGAGDGAAGGPGVLRLPLGMRLDGALQPVVQRRGRGGQRIRGPRGEGGARPGRGGGGRGRGLGRRAGRRCVLGLLRPVGEVVGQTRGVALGVLPVLLRPYPSAPAARSGRVTGGADRAPLPTRPGRPRTRREESTAATTPGRRSGVSTWSLLRCGSCGLRDLTAR